MGYEQISTSEFTEAEGVEDWRVLGWQAYALYRTGSFAKGLALVNEIGRLAEKANHHPDLNLRYPVLEVRLATHATSSLTTADLELAQQISAAARNLGVPAEPDGIAATEIAQGATGDPTD